MPEITETTIEVRNPGTQGSQMPVTLLRPESGTGGGIVLVQEIFGRSDYMRSRARDLCDLGYTVVLPQLFWRVGEDVIDEGSPDALQVAMDVTGRLDWDLAIADVRDAVAWLRADEDSDEAVALVGFCFGGGLAYAASQDCPREFMADALVSYYGSALPGLVDGPPVHVESLHHFGDSDAFIDAGQVAHIREVVERDGAEFHVWEGANHAFDNPAPELGFHDPRASRVAWEVTVDWLAQHHPV